MMCHVRNFLDHSKHSPGMGVRIGRFSLGHLGRASLSWPVALLLGGCGSVGVDSVSAGLDGGPDGGLSTDTNPPLGDGGSPGTDIVGDGGSATDTHVPSATDTSSVEDGGFSTGSDTDSGTHPPGTTDTYTDTATDRASDTKSPTDTEDPVGTDADAGNEPSVCDIEYSAALGCAGFENGDTWSEATRYGTLETVTDPVYDGNQAIHARTEQSYDYAHATVDFPPLTGGSVYVRGYYYIPPQPFTGIVKVAAFRGWNAVAETGEPAVDINISETGAIVVYVAGEPEGEDHFESAGQPVPWGSWFCLQGGVALSDNEGTVTVSVGGADQIVVEMVDTLPPSGISLADVGIGWTEGATGPMDVYADNFVVDTAPIPCD